VTDKRSNEQANANDNGLSAPVIMLAAGAIFYAILFFSSPSPEQFQEATPSGKIITRHPSRMEVLTFVAFDFPTYMGTWFGVEGDDLGILDRCPLIVGAGLILSLAWFSGTGLLTLFGVAAKLTRLERLIFATGAGLNLVSLTTLAIGLSTGFTIGSALLWITPLLLLGAWGIWRTRQLPEQSPEPLSDSNDEPAHSWLEKYGLWLAVPFVLSIVLGGMLPPVDFDVREYHLQTPKEWFQNGSINFFPHNVYSNMPLGAETPATMAMTFSWGEWSWWWGALVGKLTMALAAPLTAAAIYAAGCRFLNRTAGVVGALVYISIPWVAHVSIQGLNEGVVAMYSFLAVYATLLALRETSTKQLGLFRGWLLLAGWMTGAAISCKYPAVLFVAIPLAAIIATRKPAEDSPLGQWSRQWSTQSLALGWFLVACAAGCGLWLAKNLWFTGNPVYPLLADHIPSITRTPERIEQWSAAHSTPAFSLSNLLTDLHRVALSSDWHSVLLWPLAIAGLMIPEKRRLKFFLGGMFLFVIVAWWFATHRIDRFWVPTLPILALLAGAGAGEFRCQAGRRLILIILGVGLTLNFLTLFSGRLGDNRYFVAMTTLREDDTPNLDPSRVNPVHRYLNEHLANDKAVLLVGDAQPFDLQGRVFYNTTFDENLFEHWMKDRTNEERRKVLSERSIQYVYVFWLDVERYRSSGNYGFSDYVTSERIKEIVDSGLLRPIEVPQGERYAQLFEVVFAEVESEGN